MSSIELTSYFIKRQTKNFEKISFPLFSHLFGFFDALSIVNLQRGSNKAILELSRVALINRLNSATILSHSDMHFIRALKSHSLFFKVEMESFDRLFTLTPNLKYLDFSNLPLKYNILPIFENFAKNCPQVRSVNLANNGYYSELIRKIIFPNLPSNLLSLNVENSFTPVGRDKFIVEISSIFPLLEELNLNNCSNFHWFRPTENLYQLVTRCKKLKILHLKDFQGIDEGNAKVFSLCANLTELNLNNAIHGTRTVRILAESCKNLIKLDLRRVIFGEEAVIIDIVKNCTKLTSIQLYSCSGSGLRLLAGGSNLQEIQIQHAVRITDDDIEYVATKCKNLTKLHFEIHYIQNY